MSLPLEVNRLPTSWQESIVVKHLYSPYSAEALAEPRTDWIEVAPFDVTDFPEPQADSPFRKPIKRDGEEFDLAAQPTQYSELHAAFMAAAGLIMGPNFIRSRVFFDHFSSHLEPGQTHTFSQPHMDGTMPGGFNMDQVATTGCGDELGLTLLGTIMSHVPTAVLHGPLERTDFEGETMTHLKSGVEESKRLTHDELPVNVLAILAPSTVHYAQRTTHEVNRRHFMRWQLFA